MLYQTQTYAPKRKSTRKTAKPLPVGEVLELQGDEAQQAWAAAAGFLEFTEEAYDFLSFKTELI